MAKAKLQMGIPPVHPGEFVRTEVLDELGLSIAKAARVLGVRAATLPKFRPGGLLLVHCGGGAGLFSAMIGGWVTGEIGSQPVVQEIRR